VKLRYTLSAGKELDEILGYTAARSPQGARHVQARIKAVVEMLVRHPKAGAQSTNPRLRRLIVSPFPYPIFYEVTADEVIIHGVRHAARSSIDPLEDGD
jgi:toxin ParE1/3/4